jgi:hypothetical protein
MLADPESELVEEAESEFVGDNETELVVLVVVQSVLWTSLNRYCLVK